MRKLLEAIAVTAELMGREISPGAAAVMAKDLSAYPPEVVIQALVNLRRAPGARFALDAVIVQIERLQPDGRPGADEAWAMIPRDEDASVVMTDEMAEAYGIALPLLEEGDQVAARMAFKDAYTRIVEQHKLADVKPKWFPSLGRNTEARERALADAVQKGRLGVEHVACLLPPASQVREQVLRLEHKQVSPEQAKANFARMREMVGKSRLVAEDRDAA